MEKLSVGQVIDRMELDEVAIKVDGNFEGCTATGYKYNKVGMYYDENDNGILKTLDGNDIFIAKTRDAGIDDYFIIMKKEVYKRLIENSINI